MQGKKPTTRTRLDKFLFEKGLVESREKAKALILEGKVRVNGLIVDKAGTAVHGSDNVAIDAGMPFVSRGGQKLEHALKHFSLDVSGLIALDIGASTGGFTDCLLQHNARKVYAVDVGYGQFSWKLRNDSRVILFEKTNIRHLDESRIADTLDMAAVDVSFISLVKVLPKALELIKPGGTILALIKPQFEAGRGRVGKGGVVHDDSVRQEVVEMIKTEAQQLGTTIMGTTTSPIKGPKGNIEYFIHLQT